MSNTMNQVKKDLDAAKTFVRLIEHEKGKKATPGLQHLLERAFMAGIKHGRESSGPSGSSFDDLFGDMLSGKL